MSRTVALPVADKPAAKAQKSSRARFQHAVKAAKALTPKERSRLVEELTRKSTGHARLVEEVKQAREEIKRGEGICGTAEEIIRVLQK